VALRQPRPFLVPPRGAILIMIRVSPLLPREGLLQVNEIRVGFDGPDEVSYVELGLVCNNVYTAPPSIRGWEGSGWMSPTVLCLRRSAD